MNADRQQLHNVIHQVYISYKNEEKIQENGTHVEDIDTFHEKWDAHLVLERLLIHFRFYGYFCIDIFIVGMKRVLAITACSINSSNYTALMTSTKVYFSSTRLLQYNVYRSNISRIIFPELNRLTSVFDKPRTKPISRNAGHSEDFKTNIDNFLYFHVTIL